MRGLNDEQLRLILRDTTAALTTQPQIMSRVRDNLLKNADKAKEVGDSETEDFLRSVIALLDGDTETIATVSPRIGKGYGDPWDALLHMLRKSDRRMDDATLGDIFGHVLAALTEYPERREAVRQNLIEGINHFRRTGDPHEEALLSTLLHLMDIGIERIDEVTTYISPLYIDMWDEFVHYAKGGRGPQAMFDMIVRDVIEAMRQTPSSRQPWFDEIQRVRADAQANGDTQTVALMDAIAKLMLSGKPPSDTPPLEGEHLACWQQILDGIKH